MDYLPASKNSLCAEAAGHMLEKWRSQAQHWVKSSLALAATAPSGFVMSKAAPLARETKHWDKLPTYRQTK
jgi:hypothetical protein